MVLEERDLPAFVLAVLEESEVTYDLGLDEEAPDFFASERRRWRRFELNGEDRVDCEFDLRREAENSYRAELRPIIAWARCFDPEDEEWEDLKIVQRFGRIFRDLAPDVRGIVERTRDGVRVRVDPETRWTGYLLFKAAWLHEPMVRKTAGQGVGPEPSVSEEVLAFTTLVAGYENSLAITTKRWR